MVVYVSRAAAVPLELQLDPVFGVQEARAATVHAVFWHGPQISQKPKPVTGEKPCQIHVFGFIFRLDKEAAGLLPNVLGVDTVVIQPVGRAIHCDADFRQIGFFSESLAPATYSSTKRRTIPFNDLLWGLTLRFGRVSVFFFRA